MRSASCPNVPLELPTGSSADCKSINQPIKDGWGNGMGWDGMGWDGMGKNQLP